MTVEDSDLALPQTLPEIFEAAAAGKVSLQVPWGHGLVTEQGSESPPEA